MRGFVPFLLLAAGIGLLVYAVVTGGARAGLFLVIPFVVGTSPAAFAGILLIMAALVAWMLGAARAWAPPPPGEPTRRASSGGVVLLGPIPIVWGSDRRVLPWMIAAGAALLVLALLLAFALE